GGGGGGWFGGAGGSGGGNPGNLYGAGGGGGSSHAASDATDVSLLQGVNQGDGHATVSFRYDTTTTLTADTTSPLFGRPVTLTATVGPDNAGAPTPTGTVTFSDGTTALATVPLTDGRAAFTTSGFQPGIHPITAAYGGDPSSMPSASASPTGVTVGFDGPCLTGAHHGPLTVRSGDSLCLGAGGSQDGPVTVRPGGALAVLGAEIHGPLAADGAAALTFCGSTFDAPVSVHGTTGFLLVGAAPGASGDCGGNTVRGPLTLTANTGGLDVSGNTVTAPVTLTANSGGGLPPEPAVPTFEADTVTGPLRCSGNAPDLTVDPLLAGPGCGA
ncbi:Ig-like domain-containing protein, partial [Streptacidiphilus jiangxiensis]